MRVLIITLLLLLISFAAQAETKAAEERNGEEFFKNFEVVNREEVKEFSKNDEHGSKPSLIVFESSREKISNFFSEDFAVNQASQNPLTTIRR